MTAGERVGVNKQGNRWTIEQKEGEIKRYGERRWDKASVKEEVKKTRKEVRERSKCSMKAHRDIKMERERQGSKPKRMWELEAIDLYSLTLMGPQTHISLDKAVLYHSVIDGELPSPAGHDLVQRVPWHPEGDWWRRCTEIWYPANNVPFVSHWPVGSKPPQARSVTKTNTLTRLLGSKTTKLNKCLLALSNIKHEWS